MTQAPADMGERLDRGHRAGLLDGLHAVLALRHGEILAERCCPGEDEDWGRPLGRVDFGPDTLHAIPRNGI